MRKLIFISIMLLFFIEINSQHNNVLVEIQTNSHCVLCPSAHAAIDSYLNNGQYKDRIVYLYYHMTFPYSDDNLSQSNTEDPNIRNNYYGAVFSTPRGIFNGQVQNNNYNNWAATLNALAEKNSPFELVLAGEINGADLTVTATLKQTGQVSSNNLVIHFAAVENVSYAGRNGINPHKNVLRKMFPDANGKNFSISQNQTVNIHETVSLNAGWDKNQLGIIAFIQDTITKEIFQAAYVSYNHLTTTGIKETESQPTDFNLFQNYPNPFNPETVISYRLATSGNVTLKVYDLLGKEIAVLVNAFQNAGIYNFIFNAQTYLLPGGIYFYRLQSGSFTQTKQMMLIK